MSIQSAKSFLDRLQNDPAFKQRLENASDDATRSKIAASEGYEFTQEELMHLQQELSSDELSKIAGGAYNVPAMYPSIGT